MLTGSRRFARLEFLAPAVFMLLLVAVGLYASQVLKPSGTVVSKDPRLEEISSEYSGDVVHVTGPWKLPQQHGWISSVNATERPQRINQSMENWHILGHPRGRGPPYFWKWTVSQDVFVPLTGNPRIVVEAQNANQWVAKEFRSDGCRDSFFQVQVVDRLTGMEKTLGSFSAGKTPERKVYAVPGFRGRPVEMKLVQRPGGECGTWSGEHSTVNRLYLRN
jgi:hypothetical protein